MTCGCQHEEPTRHNLTGDNPFGFITELVGNKEVGGIFGTATDLFGDVVESGVFQDIGRGFTGFLNELTGQAAEERAEDAAQNAAILAQKAAADAATAQRNFVIIAGVLGIAGTYLMLRKR